MRKDFFPRSELERAGFSTPLINVLEKVAKLSDTIDALGGVQTTVATVTDDLTDANNTIDTLDARIDAIEAFTASDARYVKQDVGPNWSTTSGTATRAAYATYVSPTISATPTQAEVQAVSDAVQAASQRIKAIIDDLTANGALKG